MNTMLMSAFGAAVLIAWRRGLAPGDAEVIATRSCRRRLSGATHGIAALTALLGCVAGLGLGASAAWAASVSTPTVKLTTGAAGATGVDYRLFFTVTSGLAASNAAITVTAPAGASFANTSVAVIDLHRNQNLAVCCTTLSNTNKTIKIPVAGAPAHEQIEVVLRNVSNPPTVGSDHMVVSTTSDVTLVNSSSYSIVAAQPISSPAVSLTSAAAGATGIDYRATFTVPATGALNGTGDSITVTAPAGTSFANTSVTVIDMTQDGANVTLCCASLSNSNTTIKTGVAGVTAGDQLRVVLRNVSNPPTVASDHLVVSTSSSPSLVNSSSYSIAAAHSVSSPVVILSNSAPNATGVTYSVTFNASMTGALNGTGDSITIAAPAGTSFASASVSVIDQSAEDKSINQCCTTLSNGNATIKIPVSGSLAGDTLQVILQNAVNPGGAAGTRHLTATTTSDLVPATSGAY